MMDVNVEGVTYGDLVAEVTRFNKRLDIMPIAMYNGMMLLLRIALWTALKARTNEQMIGDIYRHVTGNDPDNPRNIDVR